MGAGAAPSRPVEGNWPGLRRDSGWGRVTRPGRTTADAKRESPYAAIAQKDPTYPQAIRNVLKDPGLRAKQALTKLTKQQKQHREALSKDETNGTHNLHVLHQALRYIPGGRQTFLELVHRASLNGDGHALSWWKVFTDLLPAQQARVDLDTVCEASGVPPDLVMGIAVSTAMRLGQDVADLVASTTLPALVGRTMESAMRIDGEHADIAYRDRMAMLQHHKFVPLPRGTSVHVHASATAKAAAAAASQPSVPTFSESLDGANEANRDIQRQLMAGEITDAEEVE